MTFLSKPLKNIKLLRVYQAALYLSHIGKLKKNAPFYRTFGIRKKLWQRISHKDIKYPAKEVPWMERSTREMIQAHPGFQSFTPSVQQALLEWNEKGFICLPGFLSPEQVDELERSVTENLSRKELKNYHQNRLINPHRKNAMIASVFRNQDLLKLLTFILGKEILPYKTISFYKSSQQLPHSDSMFLTTEPLGYLIGGWLALEDIHPDSGVFTFYPKSHKLPYIFNADLTLASSAWRINQNHRYAYENKVQQIIEEHGLKAEPYLAKKGDLLIWHGNLLHGTSQVINSELTRKSLVLHYFAKDVFCYHESTERPVLLKG
jgi:ectoine hydroxylase